MRPSPLQLQHVIYEKVSVLPHSRGKQSKGENTSQRALGFDFEGVGIRANIGTARRHGQDEDPRDFLVNLEIVVDNKEGKTAPYDIDVGVVGVFNVLPSLPKEKREDLVTVNGASILYGVIRELVLLLTSRFSAGALTLPGMNFEDSAPSARTQKTGKEVSPSSTTRRSKVAGKAAK
jgi:preprotein translocase subunit SecB